MAKAEFDALLQTAKHVHEQHPDVAAFCPFPTDLEWQGLAANYLPPARLMENDTGLTSDTYAEFRDLFIAASPHATWRETYRGTSIGDDFLARFGCYELIGEGGQYNSTQMRSFVVYAPSGLWYPWHHHPAEELYLILAGEAEFLAEGKPTRTLRPGDTAFHAPNQSHAMETYDKPVLAYVLWRGDLKTPPMLSDIDGILM